MRLLFNRYELREKIGSGGLGEVYRAWDRKLEREVAIKEIPLRTSRLEEVLNEGRAIARLNHPNIVTLFDLEVASRSCYLIMDYLQGVSLNEALRRLGPLPFEVGIYLFYQYLKGLDYAHQNQVIHGDLKPGNLLILPNGQGKITDFGLAKVKNQAGIRKKGFTPAFAPPEVIKEGILDAKSDVYSICLSFYTSLTGKNPFQAETPEATAHKVLNIFLPPLSRKLPEIPLELGEIVSEALNKKIENRPSLSKVIEVWKEHLPAAPEAHKKTRQFFQPLFVTKKEGEPFSKARKKILPALGALFFSFLSFSTFSLFNLGYLGLNLSLSFLGGTLFFLFPFASWLIYFAFLLVLLVSKNLFLGLLLFLLLLFVLRWVKEKPYHALFPFFAPYSSLAYFDFLPPFLCGFSSSFVQALSISFFSYLINLFFFLFFKSSFPYLKLSYQPLIDVLSPLETKTVLSKALAIFTQNPGLFLELFFYLSVTGLIWIANRFLKGWWLKTAHFVIVFLFFFLHLSLYTLNFSGLLIFSSFSLRFSLSALSFLALSFFWEGKLSEKWTSSTS